MTTNNTTSSIIEETTTTPRDIRELLTLDYSEMTSEEIDLVVDWKAERKANEQAHIESMQKLENTLTSLRESARESYNNSKACQDELLELSRELFNKALGN